MAYEHDPVTGRTTAERQDRTRIGRSTNTTPWLVAAAVIVVLVALLWFFGGSANQPPVNATGEAPITGGEVAPMGAAPDAGATGGAVAPAPDAVPAPAAPID